jgi:hypothetical protein
MYPVVVVVILIHHVFGAPERWTSDEVHGGWIFLFLIWKLNQEHSLDSVKYC